MKSFISLLANVYAYERVTRAKSRVERHHTTKINNNNKLKHTNKMKRNFMNFDGGGYTKPTLFITETPPEEGFFQSTGKGDIDDPNEEEWDNPFA